MKKLLFAFAMLLMVVSVGAQTTRIKLTQIEKANTVNGTKANQVPVSNGVGDLRYSQYVEINPTSIGYTPAATGNPVANYSQFVRPANNDIWYIDGQGQGIRLYVSASAGDYDWLEIGNNQIPNSITDSIYKYKYASVGGRVVYPRAEFLVVDSAALGLSVVSGFRLARIGLYDNDAQTWGALHHGAGSTQIQYQNGGAFSIQASGGTLENQTAPFVEHFVINSDSAVQFPLYPSTRTDAGTPTKLWGPDANGKMKNYAVSALPVTLPANVAYRDSVNTFTRNQINSYASTSATPAQRITGTWFTGGGTTNTKPHYLIEPAGTTSTAWSNSGTGLGINAPSGFTGNLVDFQLNGTSRFRIESPNASFVLNANGIQVGNTISGTDFLTSNNYGYVISTSGRLTANGSGVFALLNGSFLDFYRLQFGGGTTLFPSLQTNSTSTATATFTAASAAIATTTQNPRFVTGDVVVFTTTGTLPAALRAGDTYYIVGVPTATSIQVSGNLGGIAIVLATTGTGTHTVTRQNMISFRNAANTAYIPIETNFQRFGAGTPEGFVTASVGTMYLNTTGSTGTTFYIKETGTGNTGWVPVAAGGITGSISSGQLAVGSGTNTISGSSALTYTGNKLQINPTYTSGASGDAGVLILGTTTGSGITAHRVVGTSISSTTVAGANDQVLNAVEINGAFTNGAFTGISNNIFAVREGGNNKFSVSSTGGASVEQLYARGGTTTVSYVAASGTAGTATRNYGGDLAFNMTFQAGGTPSISDYIEVTFATPLPTGTKPIVTWSECSGTDLGLIYKMYISEIQKSNTKFRFYFQVIPPTTSRTFDVHIIGG